MWVLSIPVCRFWEQHASQSDVLSQTLSGSMTGLACLEPERANYAVSAARPFTISVNSSDRFHARVPLRSAVGSRERRESALGHLLE